MATGPRIDTLDRSRCLELLASAQVGRVAFTARADGAYTSTPEGTSVAPRVVPVSYVLDGDSIVVRTTHGSQLGRSAPGAVVTFEVDEIRPVRRDGWSVVVTARAAVEEDPEVIRGLSQRLSAWAPGFKDLWLRLPLERVSGRLLTTGERVVELPEAPAARWREHEGWTPPVRTSPEAATDFDGR